MNWKLNIRNIGGIEEGTAEFTEGHNVIQASNFKGKSSLINGMKTSLGITGLTDEYISEIHPLTESKDDGYAELDTGEHKYRVDLVRNGLSISDSGNPYLTDHQDRICSRLFGSLDENNPIRSAVREQNFERLTKLLKKPLDIEKIDQKIERKSNQRKRIEEQLDEAKKAAKEIPSVQESVTQIKSEIEELEQKKEELEGQVEEDQEQKDIRSNLTSKETRLSTIENRINNLESTIKTKKTELENKKNELKSIEIPDEPEMEANVEEKRDKIDNIELQINLLNDVYQANKAVIDDRELDLITKVDRGISETTVRCWLSDDETTVETIEENLEEIRQKKEDLVALKSDLEDEINTIEAKQNEIEQLERKQRNLESDIETLEFDIKEAEYEIEEKEEKKKEVEAEIGELQEEFEEIEEDLDSELTDIERKIGRKESELERQESRLEKLDDKAEEKKEKQKEVDAIKDELEGLRSRRDKKEREIENRFNKGIEEFEERFGLEFSARINRKTKTDGTLDEFEIEIGRGGISSEIENLSEGEVELVGIVTAIAGYQTFNVEDRCPVIIIDGIGQLAAEHIRNLMDYFNEIADVTITTAYPEAGDFEGTTIKPTEWNLVEDKTPA